jgi:hypothetical protein
MAAYATVDQLQDYLGVTRALPQDAQRLLDRASELIEYVTLARIDTARTEDAEAAQRATCAQVEFWLETDESHAVLAPKEGSVSQIGSLQVQNPSQLAPRARMVLSTAGLLFRGVRLQIRPRTSQIADDFENTGITRERRVL